MRASVLLLLALVGRVAFSQGAAPEDHEIKSLPGLSGGAPFKQYAGYVTVDADHGRNLFYWFVESQQNPAKDPLVLWLNGGPGCSSLGGLLIELGPFRPNKDQTLSLNDYAWNKVANIIFLESPSGVGFSYSKDKADYVTGDAKTAADVLTFLVEFLKMYPSLKDRDFFIAGESYGGHYVPTTARAVLNYNAANPNDQIQLKGIFAGNPWTDPQHDNTGIVQTWFGYNLITEDTSKGIYQYCNLSNMEPLKKDDLLQANVDPQKCNQFLNQASSQTGGLNPYDIYRGLCTSSLTKNGMALLEKFAMSDVPLKSYAKHALNAIQEEDLCIEEYATSYLNNPAVQDAIHAVHTTWGECNMQVNRNYSHTDFITSMLPVYRELVKTPIRIIVYSGDVDAVCPTHGSRNWINSLAMDGTLNRTAAWEPWQSSDKQVGGYITRYGERFTFTSIHGAGHMVPGTQPVRALDMFSKFLNGTF